MDIQNTYKNGKIYKITSTNSTDCYIGSTTQPLNRRLVQHRSAYKHYLNSVRSYQSSFDIFKAGNVSIELIQEFPCNNKDELEFQESLTIRKEVNCINKRGRNTINSVSDRKAYMKSYMNNYKKKISLSPYEKLNELIKKKEEDLKILKERLLEI